MADDGRTCLSFPRAPRYLRLHRGYIVVAFISEQTNGPPPRPFSPPRAALRHLPKLDGITSNAGPVGLYRRYSML